MQEKAITSEPKLRAASNLSGGGYALAIFPSSAICSLHAHSDPITALYDVNKVSENQLL
jgi:predicted RNase H-like nuclease